MLIKPDDIKDTILQFIPTEFANDCAKEVAEEVNRLAGELHIGEFTIFRNRLGVLWIRADSGEAMELNLDSESALGEALVKFWREKF